MPSGKDVVISTIPKYDAFLLPTLQALDQLGGSANNDEIEDALIKQFAFTQKQLNESYPKTRRSIIPARMSWARTYLKISSFLDNPKRAEWVLTKEGREALKLSDAEVRNVVKDAAADAAMKKDIKKQAQFADVLAADISENPDWSTTLLEKLQSIDPAAFERLSQRLLLQCGFTRVEVTGKSGDGGIDG